VVLTTGLLSAFLVNDIVCLVMTPFVVHLARRLHLPPIPYVIAVATASNIGSTATITGNPQNMLIGSLSGIAYLDFMIRLGPVALVGLVVNWALVHRVSLRGGDPAIGTLAPVAHAPMRRKPVIVLAIVLGGFFAGVPPAMAAAVGAALLLITRTVEPRRVYDQVDWGLLVFFVGLFIIVAGADRAGLTASLMRALSAGDLDRLPVFVTVTAVLSNLVSNVPAVMLLRTAVTQFADAHGGWLALAMASTLAGNLTIAGSVANIIVVERAASEGVRVGFGDYLRVGAPVTLATLTLGTLWLWVTG
jgi:Na+/H+ antiporter NhaD/arsenite permease-like protein